MIEPLDIDLPVRSVTVMEDRARIVRRGRVALSAGAHRLVVRDVAPVVVLKTLMAKVEGGRVRDARVERRVTTPLEARREEARALQELLDAEEDAQKGLERTLARLEEARALAEAAATQTIEEMQTEVAWGRFEEAAWTTRLDDEAQRLASIRETRLEVLRELAEKRREVHRLRLRRQASRRADDTRRADLHVEVDLEMEGEHELAVEYLVPNACWRPYHRCSLEGTKVIFESGGCIWQNTGEDWSEAELRLSTQRPSLGAEPPPLSTETLRVQRRAERVVVERREERIEDTGPSEGTTESVEVPGVDDGGEVMELRAPHPAEIPADGRPHRIDLWSFEAVADSSLECAPELVEAVIRKTVQTHEGTLPILAGPVDLIRDGGRVGRTTVLFVAPGARFELGWGPEPTVRVHREVEVFEPETNLLRSWTAQTHKVVNKLSHLGDEALRLTLVERVPVSEVEKVRVEVDPRETEEGVRPDEDGFLRWSIELAPRERRTMEHRYTLHQHADVVGG